MKKIIMDTVANPIKLFTALINKFCNKLERLSIPGLFQPSLILAGKDAACLSEAPFMCSTLG